MLSTRVIPCLDVHNGRTVKGVNFIDLIDAGLTLSQASKYLAKKYNLAKRIIYNMY